MNFFIVLLAVGFAQDGYIRTSSYQHADADSAAAYCAGLEGSYVLCSSAQLFQIVYSGFEGQQVANLCYSGWTSDPSGDYQAGWFMADENSCGGTTGWRAWAPAAGWGAHCCLDSVPGINPASCADHECVAGSVLVDNANLLFCADGTCEDDTCCKSWEPAASYATVPATGYPHNSAEEAAAACVAEHEDLQLCTGAQLEAQAIAGEHICRSGYFIESYDDDGNAVYNRGYYVNEEWAATGACGSISGWKWWAPADNKGTAHCCTSSYTKLGYGSVGASSSPTLQEDAVAACAALTYTPTLCSSEQAHLISEVENRAICTSGVHRESLEENAGIVIGWWQGAANTCGATGWRGWAAGSPGVHCCADWAAEYVYEVLEWDYMPLYYSASTYSTKALGRAGCQGKGYDGLCTIEQVIWVATERKTDLCAAGWVENMDTAGYWNTAGNCGNQDEWNDSFQPATPVAYCCQADTPGLPYVTVLDPYYNGNWDYNYASIAEAEAKCDSGNGYSLCTKDQLYTIAYVGVARSDETVQQETNICRNGWLAEDIKGWYQVDSGVCGATGWREITSAKAGYHCCLGFESAIQDPTPAPTNPPAAAFQQASSGYVYTSQEQAAAACTEIDADYTLCSASQIIEVALNGASGNDDFTAVEAQTSICHSSWLNTDNASCDEPKPYGWYRVDSGCGGPNKWKNWVSGGDSNPIAGAFCCAPTVVASSDYRDILGCPAEEEPETTTTTTTTTTPTTTTTTTGAPTSSTTTAAPEPTASTTKSVLDNLDADTAAALGIDTTNIVTGGNQYYIFDSTSNTFVETCVGFGASGESCDYTTLVCGGVLKADYGSWENQGTLLAEAIANGNVHASCPPSDCVITDTGFDPAGFEDDVEYCKATDGCYYMNGMATCVCDTSADVAGDLQTLWEDTFELSQCEETRPFDEVMRDQLEITDSMIDSLEAQIDAIPDVEQQLSDAQADLTQIWQNWESEIVSIINAATADATASGDSETAESLRAIIAELENLSP